MIAGFLFLMGLIKRVLIVAPVSILGVWEDEFKNANFDYEVTILSGSGANKRKQIEEVSKKETNALQIIVVNYESSWRLQDSLINNFNADLIIADEGHKIKDGKSSQSKGLHAMSDKAKYRLLLTGTPVTGKEIDLFSEFRFVNKYIYGESFYRWRCFYFNMTGFNLHVPVFKKELFDEFQNKFMSVSYRVRKDECLDLPEQTEEIIPVELEPDAKKYYKQLDEELYTQINQDKEITTTNVLTKILRLSQLTGGYLTDDEKDVNVVSTAKMEALIDLVDRAMNEDKKLVIIARFKAELDAIEDMLSIKKIRYSIVRGGIDAEDRNNMIRDFQENPECKVFVGQIATCGLGITLTSASTMIFYSLDYSMSNHEQCRSRIHRAGQTKNCHYIYLVAKGTIDRKVLRAIKNKVSLAESLVDDYRNGKKTTDEK